MKSTLSTTISVVIDKLIKAFIWGFTHSSVIAFPQGFDTFFFSFIDCNKLFRNWLKTTFQILKCNNKHISFFDDNNWKVFYEIGQYSILPSLKMAKQFC